MSKNIKSIKSKPKIKLKKPKIGDSVEIAIKPYKGKKEIGIVKKVLTKRRFHTRGHKVELKTGTIGRIIRFLKICKKCGKIST